MCIRDSKYGVPLEANMVFDVRFLPNPYFVEHLRPLTGLDDEIQTFVHGSEQSQALLQRTTAYLEFMLPQYQQEGRGYVTVAIGCTGGRHRSVVLVETIAQRLRDKTFTVVSQHRDLQGKDRKT